MQLRAAAGLTLMNHGNDSDLEKSSISFTPCFCTESASLRHPWAELTCLCHMLVRSWKEGLPGPLASEDLSDPRGLSIPHNHAGLVLFIAA